MMADRVMMADPGPRPARVPLPTLLLGLVVLGPAGLLILVSFQAALFFGLASPGAAAEPLAVARAGSEPVLASPAVNAASATGVSRTADGSGHPTEPVGPDELESVEGIRVHHSIAADVAALLAHARADGVELSGWGWRDTNVQIRLRREHCGTSDYAVYRMPSSQCSPPTARPGRSQHERGLAIDFTYFGGSISTRRSPGYVWLSQHASAYGLKNLPSEPWHWSTTGR